MENETIIRKLNRIEQSLTALKQIFNVDDLVEYTGFKKSYVYKLVHRNEIPYSKPTGGMLFFDRKEIDAWLMSKHEKSDAQIQQEALDYIHSRR